MSWCDIRLECIHKKNKDSKDWGVNPDVKVELTPNEIRDVIEIERDSEIVRQVNGQETQTSPATTTTAPKRKYPPTDIQLKAALVVMKARLELGYPWKTILTRPVSQVVSARN